MTLTLNKLSLKLRFVFVSLNFFCITLLSSCNGEESLKLACSHCQDSLIINLKKTMKEKFSLLLKTPDGKEQTISCPGDTLRRPSASISEPFYACSSNTESTPLPEAIDYIYVGGFLAEQVEVTLFIANKEQFRGTFKLKYNLSLQNMCGKFKSEMHCGEATITLDL